MDKIKSILRQINKIRNFLLIAGIVIFTIVYFNPSDLKEISSLTLIRKMEENLNAKAPGTVLDYFFIQNISQYPFFGEWSNLDFEKPNFDLDHGEATVSFSFAQPLIEINANRSNKTSSSASSLLLMERNQSLGVSFLLKDGDYLDNIFKMNTSLQLPIGFYDNITQSIATHTPLKLTNKNITVTITYGEYLSDCPNETYNSTDIEIIFIPNYQLFSRNIEFASSNFFSNITLKINNTMKGFKVNIDATMYSTDGYFVNALNYSIMLTIIGLIEIYYSTHLLIEVSNNIQSGLNLDVITIVLQIMWNSVLCSIHFFLALSFDDLSYEYGTPSIVFFVLFSIFQMKTLFLSWKSRYNELFHQDILLFRRKLLQFYSFFYMALFLFLISLRYWYNNFVLVYLIFLSTWLFQIIHSAKTGTKPPLTFSYIIFLSLSKVFMPIYIKAFPRNIFGLRPAYGKVFSISLTIFIEAIILSLQKILGPKFIIPKIFREKTFEYYQNMDCISDLQNDCVICLEKLEISNESINIGPTLPLNSNIKSNDKTCGEYIIDFILKFKAQINKKEYMLTPCGHSFHTACLEKWMEMKNECPYCRNKIPPLDY